MAKITFMGAGSSTFVKNILGDSMLSPSLREAHYALYDIDPERLDQSRRMLEALNTNVNEGRAHITAHLGAENRKEALRGAKYVINAIQVGGYKPSTLIDFEIPRKYGLRQTIADTLGIGGIFRALRTIPVVLDFARDMREVCPGATFLNYTNPMAMITMAFLAHGGVKGVGLCHSVQSCARDLCKGVGLDPDAMKDFAWTAAGINHQCWLLSVRDGALDLYPEIRRRAGELVARERAKRFPLLPDDAPRSPVWMKPQYDKHTDLVRLHLLGQFGYYLTESSEHSAEYVPWYIKSSRPQLTEEFNIPLDEYLARCEWSTGDWAKRGEDLVNNKELRHERTHEYCSFIMEAMETGVPFRLHGNVLNTGGLVSNLPEKACVETPCLVDRNGIQPIRVGDLPEACAALNRTNVNVQILTVEAAITGRREHVYQAAMLDPHTGAELAIDEIRSLCDELIEAHGPMLPKLA